MLHTKIIDTKDSKLSIQKAENFISSQDYGASIFFTGTVRNQNNDEIVNAITYDSHDELVLKSFEEIYDETNRKLNIKDKSSIFRNPSEYSKPLAVVQEGRLCLIKKCKADWCKIKTGKFTGWIKKENLVGRL